MDSSQPQSPPGPDVYLGPQRPGPGTAFASPLRQHSSASALGEGAKGPGWAGEASRKSSMASEASLGQPPSRAVSIPARTPTTDRWTTRKSSVETSVPPVPSPAKSNGDWKQGKLTRGRDDWRGAPSTPEAAGTSLEDAKSGPGRWGRAGAAPSPTAAPAVRDKESADDWRARKLAGPAGRPPSPRASWDQAVPVPGSAEAVEAERQRMQSEWRRQRERAGGAGAPGKDRVGSGAAPWDEGGPAPPVSAFDFEAERQRMQAQWRRETRPPAGEAPRAEVEQLADEELERWREEALAEERGGAGLAPVSSHAATSALVVGGSALGAGPPPEVARSVAGADAPAQRPASAATRSRFEDLFKMREGGGAAEPAFPGAGGRAARGAAAPCAAASSRSRLAPAPAPGPAAAGGRGPAAAAAAAAARGRSGAAVHAAGGRRGGQPVRRWAAAAGRPGHGRD
ncbi:hypothetical protein QBZ16_001294 [Prototheca wickerhamii]|uniref:Uncharacterized protein n=1 Tax=Prototheca wickerhamii TaxID=3111 RepID=A0AAD9IEF7_PROWI|nr:hypothetical protein QBZ16_001294 [Prototheca wickerhamii]